MVVILLVEVAKIMLEFRVSHRLTITKRGLGWEKARKRLPKDQITNTQHPSFLPLSFEDPILFPPLPPTLPQDE